MKMSMVAMARMLAGTLAACGGPRGQGQAGQRGRERVIPPPSLAQQQAQARSVTVITLQPQVLASGVQASGSLLPREEIAIFPNVNGNRVLRVLVDEGDYVRAGQPLAVLDDTLLRAQIDQQTALAEQQRVQAERARSEAARVNGLDNEGILSREAIEARRFAARAAAAQANAQAASLRDLRTRRGELTIRAPYGGLVIERTVRSGDIAAGTSPWFRIARGGEVELAADVAESALSSLTPGTGAQVTLADGTQVAGSVRLVSPRVDVNTKLGRVRITLPVRPDVRSGGFARANFTNIGTPVLAVPETAIRYDAAGAAVMMLDRDNRVSRREVTTGRRGGGFVEILTGPPAGSRVVARFGAMLVSGDVVRPVQAAAARPPLAVPQAAPAAATAPATVSAAQARPGPSR